MKNSTRRQFIVFSILSIAGCSSSSPQRDTVAINNASIVNSFKIEESIIIDKPIQNVFSFVIDLANANKISSHLTNINIAAQNGAGLGSKYKRQLIIHGFKNDQEVIVTGFERNKTYKTSTKLFDVDVHHTYFFKALDDGKTQITLIKEAPINGFADQMLKPFIIHQLTRPEHDGQHLVVLKNAVETNSSSRVSD